MSNCAKTDPMKSRAGLFAYNETASTAIDHIPQRSAAVPLQQSRYMPG